MLPAAILDVDGTLYDSSYHHALAWARAFRDVELVVPVWIIHRHIGMGGDQLVEAVAGEDVERRLGDELREAEGSRYRELIDEVVPFAGARELILALKERGHRVVLGSSSKPDELDRYLDGLGVRDVVDAWTSSGDVEDTKPAPDIVETAMAKVGQGAAVMVGDSTWDVVAAKRAGIPTIGLLCGGFSEAELLESGAVAVYESPVELRRDLADSPLGKPVATSGS
jgi:HAD superfamily hydrolase (TIGR01549 family)